VAVASVLCGYHCKLFEKIYSVKVFLHFHWKFSGLIFTENWTQRPKVCFERAHPLSDIHCTHIRRRILARLRCKYLRQKHSRICIHKNIQWLNETGKYYSSFGTLSKLKNQKVGQHPTAFVRCGCTVAGKCVTQWAAQQHVIRSSVKSAPKRFWMIGTGSRSKNEYVPSWSWSRKILDARTGAWNSSSGSSTLLERYGTGWHRKTVIT